MDTFNDVMEELLIDQESRISPEHKGIFTVLAEKKEVAQ